MSIHDAIKQSSDPRELRIAIALADIRLRQLDLSAQIDNATLEPRGAFIAYLLRTGMYFAELPRRCGLPTLPLVASEASISEFLVGLVLGLLGAAVFAWAI